VRVGGSEQGFTGANAPTNVIPLAFNDTATKIDLAIGNGGFGSPIDGTVTNVRIKGIGVNPFGQNRSFARGGQTIYVYRAPITGNDSDRDVKADPVVIDSYAVDPFTRHLWLHIPGGWVKCRTAATTIYVPQANCSWQKVTSSTDPNRIIIPNSGTGFFNLTTAQIEQCINNNLPNASGDYVLPVISEVPWELYDNSLPPGRILPQFIRLPMSLQSLCSSTRAEIHGLGYYVGSGNPYSNPASHPGIDIFSPVGGDTYSIADNGLIVGIGVEGMNTRSAGNWGATTIQYDVPRKLDSKIGRI
jgi:hypothetical protein